MLSGSFSGTAIGVGLSSLGRACARRIRPGVIGSLLLHGLLVLLLLDRMIPPETQARIVPVDLVFAAEETKAPPPPQAQAAPPRPQQPQQKAGTPKPKPPQVATLEPPPSLKGIVPPPSQPPIDALQLRLEALAKLKQPQTDSRLKAGAGAAGRNASGDGTAGTEAAYSVKDLIRAQIERRWNLDLSALGSRNFVIPIHLVLDRDGTVTTAEIVDTGHSSTDALYDSIAISARNAALLSSPLALPEGSYDQTMDIVLNLNPRDTLR